MKAFHRIILAATSGLILSVGWYEWGTGLLLLVGFIPLLLIEDELTRNGTRENSRMVYLYASFVILVWNVIATWWIKNASFAGLLSALFISSFFLSFPIMLFSMVKGRFGRKTGYLSLIVFWIAFEFALTHGEIAWPWLSLGNGFLYSIRFVQWYEFTGVFGGSLWVLLVNVLLYEIIRKWRSGANIQKLSGKIITAACLIVIPVLTSVIRYYSYEEKNNPREMVVVQPNIDPYMKFNDIPSIEQTTTQVDLAAKYLTAKTDYVVCPETSISNNIWISRMSYVPDIISIKNFVNDHPQLKYVVGVMCYQRYTENEKTKTSNPLGKSGYYFDSYNSAIQIDTSSNIPIYHKSMLVTGVEKMPYKWLFKPLEKLTLKLGGIFRNHGINQEREVFTAANDSISIAPVICYESVFGEFVTDYIKLGAQYIFVITNDGWWGDTPGHRQHNALSSLRAIETRRSIARSANTGISSLINQRGDVLQKLDWWQRDAIRGSLNANSAITFYVKHGDYIGRAAFYSALLLLLMLLVNRFLITKREG